MARFIDD